MGTSGDETDLTVDTAQREPSTRERRSEDVVGLQEREAQMLDRLKPVASEVLHCTINTSKWVTRLEAGHKAQLGDIRKTIEREMQKEEGQEN